MDFYQTISTIKTQDGKQIYITPVYPDIPLSESDVYLIAQMGDRLDRLAYDFYGDATAWRIIAMANAIPGDSVYLQPGIQIRVPKNISDVKNLYLKSNQ